MVFASLEAGSATHPTGSALVKQLYGPGDQVLGWSVMVKVQDESAGGAGWYWFVADTNSPPSPSLGKTLARQF